MAIPMTYDLLHLGSRMGVHGLNPERTPHEWDFPYGTSGGSALALSCVAQRTTWTEQIVYECRLAFAWWVDAAKCWMEPMV